MDLQKASHYRSFFETAQKIKDPESRLAFYDALDLYRFEGKIPENLPFAADLAFTAVKCFIDADKERKCGGAPKGNQNARKKNDIEPEENETEDNLENNEDLIEENNQQNNIENNSENNLKTTSKQPVDSEKTNNDKENDKENVKEDAAEKENDAVRVQDVERWCSEKNLILAAKDLRNITTALIIKKQSLDYLDYAFNYVTKKSYKARDGTLTTFKELPEANQRGMFITAVTTWQDMEQGYVAWHDEQEEKKASKPPSCCPVCHNPVEQISYGALCRHCNGYVIRQDGKWILEPWTNAKLKIVLPGNKSG